MPVQARADTNRLCAKGCSRNQLCAIVFSRSGQVDGQRIGTGKGVMVLDDGDTGTGRQPTIVFAQASGTLLKLLQVFRGQRQAKTPITDESNIIAAEHDRPEGNEVVAVFVRQLDPNRQMLAQAMNDDLPAVFIIDNSLDEPAKHRIERSLRRILHLNRELPQFQYEFAVLVYCRTLITDVTNALAHTVAVGMHNGNMAVFACCGTQIFKTVRVLVFY